MSQLVLLAAAGTTALVLTAVVVAAPLRSRAATYVAALLVPLHACLAWLASAFIAPLAATIDPRDPVEEFDLWMTGAVVMLSIAAVACLVRLGAAAGRTLRAGHLAARPN